MKKGSCFLHINRHVIFLLILFGTACPLIFVLNLPVDVSENVQKAYDLIESIPPHTPILISFDYDPAAKPEIQPMAIALIVHAFSRDIPVVGMALWPMGVQMYDEALETILPMFPEKKYGIDYVNLGYKAGGMVTINHVGKDFIDTFPVDAGNRPTSELPILNKITNFNPFGCVISLSAGDPGIVQWVMIAHDTYGRPVIGGTTAVQAPMNLPYVNEQQQLTGLLGGLKGAAEYEKLINLPGTATRGMDAQSMAHLIIILLIILGNIGYFVSKKDKITPIKK